MGNICRSPLAEGVFIDQANQRGVADQFRIDSAGTGCWHSGKLPDKRMREVAQRHGITLASLARQVNKDDFRRFDQIICMDRDNRQNLLDLGADENQLSLMMQYHPQPPTLEVPDPYYGGMDGFENVFELVTAASSGLLDHLLADSQNA